MDPGREQIWRCPTCESWQIIPVKAETVECREEIGCGQFCFNCNRKSHQPVKCRVKSERVVAATEQQVSLLPFFDWHFIFGLWQVGQGRDIIFPQKSIFAAFVKWKTTTALLG